MEFFFLFPCECHKCCRKVTLNRWCSCFCVCFCLVRLFLSTWQSGKQEGWEPTPSPNVALWLRYYLQRCECESSNVEKWIFEEKPSLQTCPHSLLLWGAAEWDSCNALALWSSCDRSPTWFAESLTWRVLPSGVLEDSLGVAYKLWLKLGTSEFECNLKSRVTEN